MHPRALPQAEVDADPFAGMQISSREPLVRLEARSCCPKCYKSRKYYCYTCHLAVEGLQGKLPHVKLPVKVDIIKHRREIDGKSTASHAAILAPDDVRVFLYPDIPQYSEEGVVLVYPSATARTVPQVMREPLQLSAGRGEGLQQGPTLISTLIQDGEECSNEEEVKRADCANVLPKNPIQRVIFIDSTWGQSRGIYKDSRLHHLPAVVLQSRISQFWRHQKNSPRWYLATVEAIHQFMLEVHLHTAGMHVDYAGWRGCFTEAGQVLKRLTDEEDAYSGQYDDLLYFFCHMYELIHQQYDHDQLWAYKRRMT